MDEIVEFNKSFVANKKYEPFAAECLPKKQMAIITCIDSRLIELLPKALNIKNGDAKIIKVAGPMILSETDNVIRSLLISIYKLNVKKIYIVGHTDCGVSKLETHEVLEEMLKYGITQDTIDDFEKRNGSYNDWLTTFCCSKDNTINMKKSIEEHPLIPNSIEVCAYNIDSLTGELYDVD